MYPASHSWATGPYRTAPAKAATYAISDSTSLTSPRKRPITTDAPRISKTP